MSHGHNHYALQKPVEDDRPVDDPRIKLAFFFTLIISGVSTGAHSLRTFALLFAMLAFSALIFKARIKSVLKKALLMEPVLLMTAAAVPFAHRSPGDTLHHVAGFITVSQAGLWLFAGAMLKGTLGIFSLSVLSEAPFHRILAGLQWFRAPKVIVQTAAMTHRYFFTIAGELHRMKRARDSRCGEAKRMRDAKTLGRMAGTLFLRSYERAERIYSAMISRGYEGDLRLTSLPPLMAEQAVFGAILLAAIISIRLFST